MTFFRWSSLHYVFVDKGNSYKFQAGTRTLALDWCRHIDRASKIQRPKVHLRCHFSPLSSVIHLFDSYLIQFLLLWLVLPSGGGHWKCLIFQLLS